MKTKSLVLLVLLFSSGILLSQNVKNGRKADAKPKTVVKKERLKLDEPVFLTNRKRPANTRVADEYIQGHLGLGDDIIGSEDLFMTTLLLKEPDVRIRFDDTDNQGSGYSYTDWQIQINSENTEDNYFAILDETYGESPFKIMGGAYENSLFVAENGFVGIGSNNPQTKLHIETDDSPAMSLNQNASGGWPIYSWDVGGNDVNFFIRDVNNSNALPFRIIPGAATNSFYLNSNGYIGLGTDSPIEKLDVRGSLYISNVLKLNALSSAPSSAVIGDIYMDANSSLLKYYNGSQWVAASSSPQTLSLSSNTLSISEGNSIDLSAYMDNTDNQNLTSATLSGTVLNIQIENGTSVSVDLQPILDDLEARVSALEGTSRTETVNYSSARLFQNTPNPYSQSTVINYFIPEEVNDAYIQITDIQGRIIDEISISQRGNAYLNINDTQIGNGTYFYSLIVDNQKLDSKIMVKTD